MTKKLEYVELVMVFYGVEILARVKSDDEEAIARLKTISGIIRNAFIPKSVKEGKKE
jgi:hypothetical protein